MAANSSIEWTKHTANLWWGCVEVSALCDHCYAREWSKYLNRAKWGADESRMAIKGVWSDLAKFQKLAAAAGTIDNVFVGSMMDIFEKPMPLVDAKGEPMPITTGYLREQLFYKVVPTSPNLRFLFLTKRPGNIVKYIPPEWMNNLPTNVMFGTSVGNQETADQAISQLLRAPGYRFLSMEPMLGPVNLAPAWNHGNFDPDFDVGIHWVICGGESGHHSRPMNPNWARSVRDQCQAAGVPFHFKQHGDWKPVDIVSGDRIELHFPKDGPTGPKNPEFHTWSDGTMSARVGKKAAGRILDGRTWDEFPAMEVPSHA